MNIIGISAYYHDSACCLIQDGKLISAAAEERFSRKKHDRRLPIQAFQFCLKAGGIGISDVDCVAFYESPQKKRERQTHSGLWSDPDRPEREIREVLGFEGSIQTFDHHQSHAASAFLFSGFQDAAILTVDGVGEWATTTYGSGQGSVIECFEEVLFPHSLGLLYSAVTFYLGFEVNDGEYKVMGLAPYGEPRFVTHMRKLIRSEEGGQYSLDLTYFDFVKGEQMCSAAFYDLFGALPRHPDSELTQFHRDVARSLQTALEQILLEKVGYLHRRVGSENLCMAGGVALNCVANGRIQRESAFKNLFVQPAAGDDGGALGAAALAHSRLTGRRHTFEAMPHAYLGPVYENDEVGKLLEAVGIRPNCFSGRESDLLESSAAMLAEGKVIGWFHGAMEFGPRALGARSILADARDPGMRERINRHVKKREAFRPFAPSVLQEFASQVFELDHSSPFMLETCRTKAAMQLPAVTHVDGSARPQTVDRRISPRFAGLIESFYRRTGCPVILNTSFNMRGEPIVCSPSDALRCMIKANLDALVIEDFIVERNMISDDLREAVEFWYRHSEESAVSNVVYTFI